MNNLIPEPTKVGEIQISMTTQKDCLAILSQKVDDVIQKLHSIVGDYSPSLMPKRDAARTSLAEYINLNNDIVNSAIERLDFIIDKCEL